MYVSVNHDRLVFLHKHQDYHVVRDLDYITRSYESASCFPICAGAMDHLTLTELQGLFRNTTGKDSSTSDEETLRQWLLQIAETLPDTDCVPVEVEKQAAFLEQHATDSNPVPQGLVYVKGSHVPGPSKGSDLYSLTSTADPTPLLPGARKAVAERKLAAQQRANAKPEPSAPGAPSAAPKRASAVARPKTGVCGLIHDALDAAYKSGQVPTRDYIKTLAQEKGWNPSTAGVQYGAWRKQNNLP